MQTKTKSNLHLQSEQKVANSVPTIRFERGRNKIIGLIF
jgi:hypothetical protein